MVMKPALRPIMDHKALVKRIMVLLVAICALGTASCSHVWETVSWRPEMDNSGWVQGEDKLGRFYTFQDESVSVILREPSHITTVSYGPTPIPIIPAFGGRDTPFDLYAEIESPTDTTIMDFSKLRVQFSGETSLQIKTVQCSIAGRPFKETTALSVSKEKGQCHLKFESLPTEVGEILLDLGSIESDGRTIRLPALKCRKMVGHRYVPYYFH
jgi:hypothetical protein